MNYSNFLDQPHAFGRHFRVVPATTSELRDACFRIRHEVYCEEFGFEPVRENGRETDEWDQHSLHCLLQSVATGQYVGCMRLVVPPFAAPERPLPFERVCEQAIDRSIVDPRTLARETIGEVSRLAVVPSFRRRKGERASPYPDTDRAVVAANFNEAPYIQSGLYLGLLAMAHFHAIDNVFMLLEPRLARQLGMLIGLRPHIVGDAVEHRGSRVPAMLSVNDVLDSPHFFARPLFNLIAREVAQGMADNHYGMLLPGMPLMDEVVAAHARTRGEPLHAGSLN